MNRSGELTKNTLIIMIGRVSTQFISFLLLPLYTSLLSTESYGMVDLLTTIVQLLIPIVSVMIDQGVFRYLLNCNDEISRKRTISSAFFIMTSFSVAMVIIYFIVSPFINNEYKIWVLLILIATAYSNLFLQIARGLKYTSDYAVGSFVCSSSTIVLNVLCIAFLKMGAVGMLIATFIGNFICCLFLCAKLKIYKYIELSNFDKEISLDELRYSLPLVPHQLSLWVMNSSDRLIVAFMMGTSANGILAVTHKFPTIYLTFFNIFLLAWHEMGAVHYFDDDRDEFFTDMLEKIISIFATLCIGIIVALPIVFGLFVNTSYHEAYYNIPIYLIASLFNVVIGLLGVVYVATKKTSEIAKTTIISAVINIVVNFCLINFIGLYAASISTLVGYFVTLGYRIIDTKKYLKIKYNIKQYVSISIIFVIYMGIYYIENIIISLIAVPFYVIMALYFNKDFLKGIISIIKEKHKRWV